MGPRRRGRGEWDGIERQAREVSGFNGAAPARARRGAQQAPVTLRTTQRFNGAAPARARREAGENQGAWSAPASMGPPPRGRGEGPEKIAVAATADGFN